MKTLNTILLSLIFIAAIFSFSCGTQEMPVDNYSKAMRSTQRTANDVNLRLLNLKVTEFHNDKERYPANLDELKPYLRGVSLKGEGGGKFVYDAESHEFTFEPEGQ